MIAYLEGQILSTDSGILVVKTLSGVGYAANIPQPLLVRLKVGDEVVLHVHTQVREDEISLYGFATTAERHLFELLIRTSGVGPKMALGVLSVMLPQELIDSVQQGDANRFAQVPGIGKKTATKLCLHAGPTQETPGSGIGSSHGRCCGFRVARKRTGVG